MTVESASPMADALIHRCRVEGYAAGSGRNAQGEREVVPIIGEWVRCRFMEVRVVAERRVSADSFAKTTNRSYELLADFADMQGATFELTASLRLRVDAPPVTPVGGWLVEVAGDPERLNDGTDVIGWMGAASRVEDVR